MNEVVKLVQEKTGLSEEMSQKVVTTVLEFLKTKVPPQFASGLESLMGSATAEAGFQPASETAAAGIADKAKAAVSSLFGGTKTA